MSKAETKWYAIRARSGSGEASASSAEVLIYGDIGASWYGESVIAADFAREIAALDVSLLTVRINSYGGSVSDGIVIHNALKRHPADVTVVIDGVAASIASLIAMAGSTVEMAENAMLMIHAPWTYADGNSAELRQVADMLDTWAEAMSTSYAAKTGRPQADMLALLTDGTDHWYTAAQAQAEGFIDAIVGALPIAASAARDIKARFASFPGTFSAESLPAAASAAPTSKEIAMPKDENPTAATAQAAAADTQAAARAERQRDTDIRASFGKFKDVSGLDDVMNECLKDVDCSVQDANAKLLAYLGKGAVPVMGSHIVTVEDEREKFIAAASQSIMARAAVRDEKGPVRVDASNPFRGHKLLDLARVSLARAGIKTDGMTQMQVVAAAFTQSTSDFPVLLENVMHKTLQQAYATAADTWSRFCAIGSVSDFRAHSRYRVGSLGNLDALNELGEFKNKTIPDGEKASITAGTKGNIINISRQTIINDDLGAFVALAAMLGRSSHRTIEAAVYALLAENAGLGPTMDDGYTLFHASHGNLVASGSGAVPSVTTIDAGRVAMASQKDVGGNDFLDLMPSIWLGPLGLGGSVRVINRAEFDPDTSNKLHKPNAVRDLFSDVVDTPRMTGSAWHMLANPNDAPVLEVAFLDGVQEPYLELENGFEVDGARYKVRLDFGVAAIDFRGAYRNHGA